MDQEQPQKSKRGFASMDPEKVREMGRKGGKACPPEKRGFARDRELAARAGSAGGKIPHRTTRTFIANPEVGLRARELAIEARRRLREETTNQ